MHEYTVEFTIDGPNLDVDEVSRALGIAATTIRRKGESRSASSFWETNTWGIQATPANRHTWPSLSDGLESLLGQIGPQRDLIHKYFPENKLYFRCGHFTSSFGGGPKLSPELLKALADFGVEVIIHTYCGEAGTDAVEP